MFRADLTNAIWIFLLLCFFLHTFRRLFFSHFSFHFGQELGCIFFSSLVPPVLWNAITAIINATIAMIKFKMTITNPPSLLKSLFVYGRLLPPRYLHRLRVYSHIQSVPSSWGHRRIQPSTGNNNNPQLTHPPLSALSGSLIHANYIFLYTFAYYISLSTQTG